MRAALDAGAARVAVNAEDAHLARGDELRASDVARAGPVIIDVDAIAEHRVFLSIIARRHLLTNHSVGSTRPSRVMTESAMDAEFFGAPAWAWVQLCAAVFAISTAGVMFQQLPHVPPLLLASWRMQATALLLAVGAASEWRVADGDVRARWFKTWPRLGFSGVCLGAHFGAWVAGLQTTTLARSLLLVCTTPLFLAFGALALCLPTSAGELAGAALGFCGVAMVASDRHDGERETATWQGDVLSLGAAFYIVGYMIVGADVRRWMPLCLYAGPVTAVAALSTATLSYLVEDTEGSGGVLGWAFSGVSSYFLVTMYLALVPGLVGHTGYNAVLKHISPLVVSTSLTMEPLLGSALGYAVGLADAPGWRTGVGGIVIVASVVTVIVAKGRN